mmetsp:Transcript_30426/g.73387  ORF Transcript_30426/g.73387 Transcript_30426/m.73387 type:complete len:323 (+) Transcript_30426:550-1518(+)
MTFFGLDFAEATISLNPNPDKSVSSSDASFDGVLGVNFARALFIFKPDPSSSVYDGTGVGILRPTFFPVGAGAAVNTTSLNPKPISSSSSIDGDIGVSFRLCPFALLSPTTLDDGRVGVNLRCGFFVSVEFRGVDGMISSNPRPASSILFVSVQAGGVSFGRTLIFFFVPFLTAGNLKPTSSSTSPSSKEGISTEVSFGRSDNSFSFFLRGVDCCRSDGDTMSSKPKPTSSSTSSSEDTGLSTGISLGRKDFFFALFAACDLCSDGTNSLNPNPTASSSISSEEDTVSTGVNFGRSSFFFFFSLGGVLWARVDTSWLHFCSC